VTSYQFYWPVLWQYRHYLLEGLLVTVQLSAVGFVLSVVLGVVVGVARSSRRLAVRTAAGWYVEFFRNVPLLVQTFYWYFAVGLGSFAASLVSLVLYSSVYIGEVIRSGVQSIPRTQLEAAYSSGLSSAQVIRHIVLPQAVMIVIPPLGTELINIVKNSAIAMTVGVRELTFQTQEIDAATFRGFEAATVATLLYLGMALSVATGMSVFARMARFETKVL
jgi:polar amino acid transport system permease protein